MDKRELTKEELKKVTGGKDFLEVGATWKCATPSCANYGKTEMTDSVSTCKPTCKICGATMKRVNTDASADVGAAFSPYN